MRKLAGATTGKGQALALFAVAAAACMGLWAAAPGTAVAAEQAGATHVAGEASLTTALAATDESEPNNSFEQADPIRMNQTVYGAPENGSGDYFKFTMPINGTLKITLWNDHRTGEGAIWFDLYDKNYNRLVEEAVSKETQTTGPSTAIIPLSRGTYYLDKCHDFTDLPGVATGYHFRLEYSIPGTTLRSLSAGKHYFHFCWTQKETAYAYQVRYVRRTTYRDYGWSKAKIITYKRTRYGATVRNAKSKTQYLLQVRVLRKIDGQVYYSTFSSTGKITTK